MATDWVVEYTKEMMKRMGNSSFKIPEMPLPDLAARTATSSSLA